MRDKITHSTAMQSTHALTSFAPGSALGQTALHTQHSNVATGAWLLFWSMLAAALAILDELAFIHFFAANAPATVHFWVLRSALALESVASVVSLLGVWNLTVRRLSRSSFVLAWTMRLAMIAFAFATFYFWRGYLFPGRRWSADSQQTTQVIALVAFLSALIIYCGRNWREILSERFIQTIQIMGVVLLIIFSLTFVAKASRTFGPRSWVWLPWHTIADLMLAFMYIAIAALAFRIHRAAKRFLAEGRCPMCLYDLQGNLHAGCPECGWLRSTPSPSSDPA